MTADLGAMQRLHLGNEVIEFGDRGAGEPILLVHGGVFSDWFAPVVTSPELDRFRVLRIRRAGYVDASPPPAHVTLGDHAAHCAALLTELGIDSAHVCGHSSGALIALELALQRPEVVQTMVLLEPSPVAELVGPICQASLPDVLGPVLAAAAGGDIANAFDLFLRAVGGEHYRATLAAALGPDAYERALRQSAFFFKDEVGAAIEWTFGPDEAARIKQPMLLVMGGETATASAVPPESVGLLAGLIPHAESTVLAGATHLMPLEDPGGVARLLAEFVRRHENRVHS